MRTTKREMVARLAGVAAAAGLTLPGLALGFVLARPEVASALLGPRTPAQLDELLATGVPVIDSDTLNAVDAIVAPGTDVNPADAG